MRMRNRTDGIVPLTENIFPQIIVVLTSLCHNRYKAILSAYSLTYFAFLSWELALSKGNILEVILGIQDAKFSVKKYREFNKGVTIVLNT